MSRGLSADLLSLISQQVSNSVFLVDLEFDSGPVRLWSGYGEISLAGNTYIGSGLLGSISNVADTSETKSAGMTLTLSGIPSEIVSLSLTEHYQGRSGTVYLGFMEETTSSGGLPLTTFAGIDLDTFSGTALYTFGSSAGRRVLAFPVFQGIMDVMTIEDGADTSSISISVENRLSRILKSSETRYTDQDQKTYYPNDRAFEYVAAIQGIETEWGKTS